MKTNLLFYLLFLLSGSALAQTDSVTVIKTDWKKQRIAPGIHLKQYWFNNETLFNSNQNISILEIKPRRKTRLDIGHEPQLRKLTSDFGKEANAIAAVNGTFFDVKNGGSVDYIKDDNQVINENRPGENGQRSGHQQAALVFKNGKLSITKWDGSADWETRLDGEDVMVSGPLLVLNEQSEKLDSNAFNKTRHPRTAIAVTKNNRILLITVDGRHENAAGMSLFELSSLMRWLKADDALNLDGGGSTTMWINGQPANGIINFPSDNKKWDHEGARKVANVVLVMRR